MSFLTRFIKGDTIKMDSKEFKLLSDGYYSDEHKKVVCDIEGGVVSYLEMMDKDAEVIAYERRTKHFH